MLSVVVEVKEKLVEFGYYFVFGVRLFCWVI